MGWLPHNLNVKLTHTRTYIYHMCTVRTSMHGGIYKLNKTWLITVPTKCREIDLLTLQLCQAHYYPGKQVAGART